METKEIGVQIDLAATGQRIEQLREERGLSMADMASVNSGRTATLARRFSHGVTGF